MCLLITSEKRQQTGRAGRRARDSLAVLVPDSLPIDQHFANNPDEMFTRVSRLTYTPLIPGPDSCFFTAGRRPTY
jgi:ATP-dependent helicase YprA (DUF1998 family)